MKSVLASALVAVSLLIAGGAHAAQVAKTERHEVVVKQEKGTQGTKDAESCKLAGERCPSCCTNNCKDCSGCKPSDKVEEKS